MISALNRVLSSALERAIVRPLHISAQLDIHAPPALPWVLRNDRLVVVFATIITAATWYLIEPIIVTYDTFAYLNAAKFIAGVEGGSFTYFRPPLLPLLLAVTGVPSRQTFFWFILTQFALGFASVMLMHDCLRRISRSIGLIAAGLFIVAFAPFVYAKSIMTEEIYLFGWCLCLNGGLAYVWTTSPWRLVQVVIALLILALTRVQGAYVIAVALPMLAIAQPRRMPALAVALVAYLLIELSYAKLHASMARSIKDAEKPIEVSSIGISDSTGKMLFTVAYYYVYQLLGRTAVAPENGPASKRMFDELNAYYSSPDRLAALADDPLYRPFAGNANALVQAMQQEPRGEFWFAIWTALDDRLGAAASDTLLLRVTVEAVLAHPFAMTLTYGRNFFVAFFRAESPYVWTHPSFGAEWVGPRLASEMHASGDSSVATPLARALDVLLPTVRFLLVIGTIIVTPFAWHSRWRTSFVFCLALVVYNQATVALAAKADSRYTFYILPPLLAAITMGLQAYSGRHTFKTASV
jgi:hypothetical protein